MLLEEKISPKIFEKATPGEWRSGNLKKISQWFLPWV